MRAVYVVTADNNDGQLEALLVRVYHHLCSGLRGSVRVGGGEDARLDKVIIIIHDLTVHLVSGDVDEALDAALLRALEHHVGTIDVGVGEAVRVTETQVDVRLGGEVEDGVNLVSLHAVDDLERVGDVSMVESEVVLVVERAGVVEGGAVVELVEGDDVVGVRVGEGEVSNEPARADLER